MSQEDGGVDNAETKEFDSAFAEFSGEAAEPGNDQDIEQEHQNNDGDDENSVNEKANEDEPGEDEKLEASAEEEDDGAEMSEAEELAYLREENEKLNHRIKSDQGRVASYQKRYQELASKQSAAPSEEEVQKALQSDEEWDKFVEEYPQIASAIDSRVKRVVGKTESDLNDRLTPLQEKLAEEATEKANAEMDDLHPGWREEVASTDFISWLDQQPPAVQALADSDDVLEASSLMQLYESAMAANPGESQQDKEDPPQGGKSKADEIRRARQQRLQESEGIQTSGAGRVSPDSSGADDFDSAFNFHAQKKARERQSAA